jgi:hypothetical protein
VVYKAFKEADIELCGGIFSGSGNDGSFRGKVYVMMILEITGVSLNQDWIPPETVREMYEALLTYYAKDNENISENGSQTHDLPKFFQVCSERGLGLVGWS